MNFNTKKFETYEQERKEREEIKNNLTENAFRLAQKVDSLSETVEKQERYSRRKCLLLHVTSEKKKNTGELCIKVINEHLDLAINDRDIDRTHCIGNPRNTGEKTKPIIFKLVRYNNEKKIFNIKKKLKRKMLAIMESLTLTRMKKLSKALNF